MFAKPTIPALLTGFDLETKGTKLSSYILSLATATFDLKLYKLIECARMELNPEDEEAKALFTTDPDTVRWWEETDKNKWSPTKLAHDITWGGSSPHKPGIVFFNKTLMQLNKRNSIFLARGPEFDMRLFEVTCRRYGLNHNLRFSNFDSDRTSERFLKALGCAEIPESELQAYIRCTEADGPLHTAHYDSAHEAYRTMRAYWLVAIAGTYGLDVLKDAVEKMSKGEFNPEEYGEIGFE